MIVVAEIPAGPAQLEQEANQVAAVVFRHRFRQPFGHERTVGAQHVDFGLSDLESFSGCWIAELEAIRDLARACTPGGPCRRPSRW